MFTVLLAIALVLMPILPTAGPRNRPPVAVEDYYVLLFNTAPVVEIPVLVNDSDPDGDVLQVTALPAIEGGTAQILDGNSVRVYLDWSREYSEPIGLVAHGTYVVSDGKADSRAVWSVWYWPFMQP